MLGEMVLAIAIGGALGLVAVDGAWAASYLAADWDRPKGTRSYFQEKWEDEGVEPEQYDDVPMPQQGARRMEEDELIFCRTCGGHRPCLLRGTWVAHSPRGCIDAPVVGWVNSRGLSVHDFIGKQRALQTPPFGRPSQVNQNDRSA
eukprot:3576406-Rhodomonas_salina.6